MLRPLAIQNLGIRRVHPFIFAIYLVLSSSISIRTNTPKVHRHLTHEIRQNDSTLHIPFLSHRRTNTPSVSDRPIRFHYSVPFARVCPSSLHHIFKAQGFAPPERIIFSSIALRSYRSFCTFSFLSHICFYGLPCPCRLHLCFSAETSGGVKKRKNDIAEGR